MYYKLIKNNITKLNKDITSNFLKKNDINVNEDDAILITNLAKENWEDLLNKKYDYVFSILKNKLKKDQYDKLLKLYLDTINQYL